MLVNDQCVMSFRSVIDLTTEMMQSLEIPFAKAYGTLITKFLTLAKFWARVNSGTPAQPKWIASLPAVKYLFAGFQKAEGKEREKWLMQLAPFTQLLEADHRKAVRAAIEEIAKQGPGGGVKRAGVKIDEKKKSKSACIRATASAASGSKIGISIFD